tara:strand:- start:333 stop:761 length:429 start_codon:yes stop_codon:yes gene_type:complete
MKRKEFLRNLGAGAAFALAYPCLNGCSKDGAVGGLPVPTGIDFTVDLDSQEGAPLQNNGGFILKQFVVVAKNLEGEYVAASQICSHQQTEEVRFITEDGGIYRCATHGARFDQNGNPLNSITPNPLKIFNTELNDRMLRVFE